MLNFPALIAGILVAGSSYPPDEVSSAVAAFAQWFLLGYLLSRGTFRLRYWLRVELVVLAIAVLMALVGGALWSATIPSPPLSARDLILPSCLTWVLLSLFVARAGLRQALLIGLASPLLGSVFVVLLRLGSAKDYVIDSFGSFLSVVLYGWTMVEITAWTTLPVGVATGFLVHLVFRRWPPLRTLRPSFNGRNARQVTLFKRYTLTIAPLLPLLTLLIPETMLRTPQGWWQVQVLIPLRLIGELYFFPASMVQFVSLHALSRISRFTGSLALFRAFGLFLKIAYSVSLSYLIWRLLKREKVDVG